MKAEVRLYLLWIGTEVKMGICRTFKCDVVLIVVRKRADCGWDHPARSAANLIVLVCVVKFVLCVKSRCAVIYGFVWGFKVKQELMLSRMPARH